MNCSMELFNTKCRLWATMSWI